MKKMVIVSMLLCVGAFLLPPALLSSSLSRTFGPESPEASDAPPVRLSPAPGTSPTMTDVSQTEASAADASAGQAPAASVDFLRQIHVLDNGDTLTMTLCDYLAGVVAAEMPASFEPEALKAQAVAARTYTLYRIGSSAHGPDTVCSDSACCCAYEDDAALRERWGTNYEAYITKVRKAVADTDGLYLTYAGKPIDAVFHSSSAGSTASSGEVWPSDLPYLQAVATPETPELVRNLYTKLTISTNEFKSKLLSAYPSADLSGSPDRWLSDVQYSDSGRVLSLRAGNTVLSGTALRLLLGLRSAAFKYTYTGDGFIFYVSGYGHGVGMSQYGANIMAESGSSFSEILLYYYTGVEISVLN